MKIFEFREVVREHLRLGRNETYSSTIRAATHFFPPNVSIQEEGGKIINMHFLYKSVYESIRRGASAATNITSPTNSNNSNNSNNCNSSNIHASGCIAHFKAVFGDDADFSNSNEQAANEVAFAFNLNPSEIDQINAAIAPWITHKATIAKELRVDTNASVLTIYQKALKEKLIKTPITTAGWADFETFKEIYEEEYDVL